jgi:hypothetical protein
MTRSTPSQNVAVLQDPHGQIDDRRSDGPDADLADIAANEADRTEQGKHESEATEHELPHPDEMHPEQPVRERAGRDGDHGNLEHRPAEALQHVQAGREIGAALAKRRAVQRHRWHACVGSDQRSRAEHGVPDQGAHDRREQRLLERQAEVRRRDEDEQ